jgi:hypothetical protein
MKIMPEKIRNGKFKIGLAIVLTAFLSFVGICGNAGAFEIPTGNENLKLRWDNTIRYSLAYRTSEQDNQLLANANADDGDRNFKKNSVVGNRIDLLSEMDLVFKNDYGFRVSGAGWYDFAYQGDFTPNTSTATSNHLDNGLPRAGQLPKRANDLYLAGGELQDLFVYGKADIGGMPLNVKLGRLTVYWGEGMLAGGAIGGIDYGQSPFDLQKGLMLPGTEAKELFMPLTQIALQAQPTDKITVLGQYLFEWRRSRFPEGGTYLGFLDALDESGESLVIGPGQRVTRGDDITPNPLRNIGVGVRYRSDWLDGTVGVYYRKFADTMPQVAIKPNAAVLPAAVGNALGYTQLAATDPAPFAFSPLSIPDIIAGRMGNYYTSYAENIDLLGISLNKTILGVSVGAELSYRWRMPLVSTPTLILPTPLALATPGAIDHIPDGGEALGARGNVAFGVLNFVGFIQEPPFCNTVFWIVEFTWHHLDTVTENAAVLQSSDAGYTGIDGIDRDSFGGAVTFTPTWYQVLPGVDLSMPLSFSMGLSGNSPVTAGGNHDSGSWLAGLSVDVWKKYQLALNYIGFFGEIENGITNGGGTAGLRDRGFVNLTFSTKF